MRSRVKILLFESALVLLSAVDAVAAGYRESKQKPAAK